MKKVLSFVLVLALVLGSFSMAFAAPAAGLSDVAGNANEDAINVANGLGIITGYDDGTYLPTKAVNRAEFAAMITRALGIPESALAGYTATSFKDTAGYGWAVKYLAFCENKGIMEGDGQGNVMPGRTINTNEAVTMVLRALGITNNSAWLVGTWPGNYVTVAKNLGLYEDVAASTEVDRAAAAQMIYNALTLQPYAVDADGATAVVTGSQALITALGATNTDKVVQYTAKTKIALDDYIGAYGTVYSDEDGNIIAVEPASKFLTGEVNASGTAIEVGDVDYDINYTSADAFNIVNNVVSGGAVSTGAVAGETVTLAVKTDGNDITKVYSIITWALTDAFEANEDLQDDIADNKVGADNSKFELDSSDKIVAGSYKLLGADSLDKIAEDDVVYLYADVNNVIRKIEVGTATVDGTITKITSGTTTKYAIDGVNYVVGEAGTDTGLVLGAKGTATLDYAGDIYKWESEEEALPNYAVVIATNTATSWGTTHQIRLFTTEGNVIDPVCDATAAAITPGSIVAYTLEDDGDIDTITTAAVDTAAGAVLNNGTIIGTKAVASDVIVMINYSDAADGVENASGWAIGKMADLEADGVTVEAITNSSAKIAVVFAYQAQNDLVAAASNDSYGLVTKNTESIWKADDKATAPAFDILVDGVTKASVEGKNVTYTASVTGNAVLQKITIKDGVITGLTNATVASVGAATTVKAIDANVITFNDGNTYQIATDAVVYKWDADDKAWTVSKISAIRKADTVELYDTKTKDENPGYEIVIIR